MASGYGERVSWMRCRVCKHGIQWCTCDPRCGPTGMQPYQWLVITYTSDRMQTFVNGMPHDEWEAKVALVRLLRTRLAMLRG
jgi:hypothetical protein